MGQEQFQAILPFISADLIFMIAEKEQISERDAYFKLYSSKLYALLEQEQTKVWQYSTPLLYKLLQQQQLTGGIGFPDV